MNDKKVIWITGASSGIGKALSIKFAQEGWIVAASARRENLLQELTKENIWVKRPGTGAILAEHFNSILGKTASKDINNDEQLNWSDFD